MILQRLTEYYDQLAADPRCTATLARPGYSLQKISFCVVLEPDGTLREFESLLCRTRDKSIARELLVPGQGKPSGYGIHPCFLWDNASYMLGFKTDDRKPQRTRQSFEAFRARHLAVEDEIDSPAFRAVCEFLRNWSAVDAVRYEGLLKDIVSAFGIFRMAGEGRFIHDDPAVVSHLQSNSIAEPEEQQSLCLITGNSEPIARLHEPKIKGVRGTQTTGALLVSFNDDAYSSFGKRQSFNAPVGVTTVFKYANALNHLLSREDRRIVIGDSTIVFWSEQESQEAEWVACILADRPVIPPRRPTPLFEQDRTRLFVLGLSPNAARISVRFWCDMTVAEMKRHLAQHAQDTELIGSDDRLILRQLILCTGRAERDSHGNFKGYDPANIAPPLAGAVVRAALTGSAYPHSLLTSAMNRIRSDRVIRHERIAAIRACLVRNSRLQSRPKEIPVSLDPTRTDPPYVTGQLFAVLERIQSESIGGGPSASIKDRYFSAACATPAAVFPRLIQLSQHQLGKLSARQKLDFEKRLDKIMSKLTGFASHLNLEDQGIFAVGYFHQRQDFSSARTIKPELSHQPADSSSI